jgi:hypothetical protein
MVIVTGATGAAHDVTAATLQHSWREAHARRAEDAVAAGVTGYVTPAVEFEVTYVHDVTGMLKALQRLLAGIR